jgi:hypothetical protein
MDTAPARSAYIIHVVRHNEAFVHPSLGRQLRAITILGLALHGYNLFTGCLLLGWLQSASELFLGRPKTAWLEEVGAALHLAMESVGRLVAGCSPVFMTAMGRCRHPQPSPLASPATVQNQG